MGPEERAQHCPTSAPAGQQVPSSAVSTSTPDTPRSSQLCPPPPSDVVELAVRLDSVHHITELDPVLVTDLHLGALQQRQPGTPGHVLSGMVAAVITGAGMQEVTDVSGAPSRLVFKGSAEAFQAAINTLCYTPWVRPAAGLPDVGRAWEIRGSTTVLPLAAPFNA